MTYILNQKVDTMLDAGTVRNHKSPGNFFRESRAFLAVSRACCTVITTHNNYHPSHYARRRDSAYMKLPGVFLHCDTCARADGVAIRDTDTPFT
jgi:hypothetical protein